MADRAIARRYAKAFLELAEEAGNIDDTAAELDRVLGQTDTERGRIYLALANPAFSLDERRKLLEAVTPRLGMSPLTDQLVAGLIMKIAGGLILWGFIAVIFFNWAARERAGWDALALQHVERDVRARMAR